MTKVEIYSTQTCPYCIQAKQLLNQLGIDYHEIDVGLIPSKRAEMTERAKRSTVPQIFINNISIGGCDDLYELHRNDKLNTLLNQN